MGLIGSLFGKPRQSPEPIPIRETLFGDMELAAWPCSEQSAESFPWSKFVEARNQMACGQSTLAVAGWKEILEHPGLEPRHYLQAWHFLRQNGQEAPFENAKQMLGVVVEVGMPEGLDLLAAYPDYSARYYNFSGAGVVWEHPDDSLNHPIDQLLHAAAQVVTQIGPWEKPRPPAPPRGHVRLSFLTPSGMHFGQGPMEVLSKDPLGGRVLHSATVLMQALIAKSA